MASVFPMIRRGYWLWAVRPRRSVPAHTARAGAASVTQGRCQPSPPGRGMSQISGTPGLRWAQGRERWAAGPNSLPSGHQGVAGSPAVSSLCPEATWSVCGILALLGFVVSPGTTEGRLVTSRSTVPAAGGHLLNSHLTARNTGRQRTMPRGRLCPLNCLQEKKSRTPAFPGSQDPAGVDVSTSGPPRPRPRVRAWLSVWCPCYCLLRAAQSSKQLFCYDPFPKCILPAART